MIIKVFWWWVKKKTSEKVAREEFFGWIFGLKIGVGSLETFEDVGKRAKI
jgi:hypothetical protein